MIYGIYSKLYTGLVEQQKWGVKILPEASFDIGSGNIKIEASMNETDWFTIVDTSVGTNLIGEEIVLPLSLQGTSFQFRFSIDIDPSIPDIDDFGNLVWGVHPKNREGEQVNFYSADSDERETWSVTGERGVWEARLPIGYYYYIYDFQNNLDKLTLPPDQYIVVGAGTYSDRFGTDIQKKFKRSDEVYLSQTFADFHWARYMITELGTTGNAQEGEPNEDKEKRDLTIFANTPKIKNGRIYKGDAYIEFIGFLIGKE